MSDHVFLKGTRGDTGQEPGIVPLGEVREIVLLPLPDSVVFVRLRAHQSTGKAGKLMAYDCPTAEGSGPPLHPGPRKLFLSLRGTLDLAPPSAQRLAPPPAWPWPHGREAEGQLSGARRTLRVSHGLRGLPTASANGVHASARQPADVTGHSPRRGLPTPELAESHARRLQPAIRRHAGQLGAHAVFAAGNTSSDRGAVPGNQGLLSTCLQGNPEGAEKQGPFFLCSASPGRTFPPGAETLRGFARRGGGVGGAAAGNQTRRSLCAPFLVVRCPPCRPLLGRRRAGARGVGAQCCFCPPVSCLCDLAPECLQLPLPVCVHLLRVPTSCERAPTSCVRSLPSPWYFGSRCT